MRIAPLRRRVFSPILLGVLALPAAAQAAPHKESSSDVKDEAADEAKEFRFEFGLTGGYHWFNKKSGLGRFTDDPAEFSPKSAVAFGGRLALNFNRYVSIEGEALGIPTHSRFSDAEGGAKIFAFAYRGSVVVHLVGSGPFRPFLLAGYGATSSIANTNTNPNSRNIPSDTDGTLHAGLGFKIAMGDYVGLRVDGRVLAPAAFLGKEIPVGNETGYDGPDFEVLGGLYLNFGEIEKVRRTIVKKEVVVQAPAANPDPDGDGISGKADKCPDIAEDKDGFEDEDGCPESDNDADGIPDAQDKCPNQPETKNGIDDEDGCPETDPDGDGIVGSRDKCPDEPETKNGFKDEDGCPDELPAAVKKFTGVIEGITFKTGQATILPGSYSILDRAVAVLKEYGDLRIEISGHTDNKGKADYNRDLSQRRADAVKMYFIGNGIDASRLTSVGYGLDRPVADNGTEAGRAKNRRTEFRLMMTDEAGGAPKGGRDAHDSGPPPP
jgi:OOP family OmpA-OmpF porin